MSNKYISTVMGKLSEIPSPKNIVTKQSQLNEHDIRKLLDGYEETNPENLSNGEHVRYFVTKGKERLFRLGGYVKIIKNAYLILESKSKGKNVSWSVQKNNTTFFKRISVERIKKECNNKINSITEKYEELKKYIEQTQTPTQTHSQSGGSKTYTTEQVIEIVKKSGNENSENTKQNKQFVDELTKHNKQLTEELTRQYKHNKQLIEELASLKNSCLSEEVFLAKSRASTLLEGENKRLKENSEKLFLELEKTKRELSNVRDELKNTDRAAKYYEQTCNELTDHYENKKPKHKSRR